MTKKTEVITHPELGELRVQISDNNEIWFVAKDICNALGIKKARNSVALLDDDEKMKINVPTALTMGTPINNQEVTAVNESGMYKLIFQSRKPQAKKFTKWVTSEVLPNIRKYGFYSTDKKQMDKMKEGLAKKMVKKLLFKIDSMLSDTDKRVIARQCMTDESEVWDVLEGRKRDAHMTALMYARATGNKILNESLYSLEGAEKLIKELEK